MKKCPYCSEEIQDSAIKCRYCGEWLDESAARREPVPAERPPEEKKSAHWAPPTEGLSRQQVSAIVISVGALLVGVSLLFPWVQGFLTTRTGFETLWEWRIRYLPDVPVLVVAVAGIPVLIAGIAIRASVGPGTATYLPEERRPPPGPQLERALERAMERGAYRNAILAKAGAIVVGVGAMLFWLWVRDTNSLGCPCSGSGVSVM